MGSCAENLDISPLPPPDKLLEVRTGKIRPLGGVSLRSAIAKVRRQGRIEVTELGLAGDEQQYALHGGVDKALHQYCASHYSKWRQEKPDRAHLFKIGGFGENLSSSVLTEDNVCIGDKFRIGSAVVVQISEPRQPCYKLNHRFEWKKAAIRTQDSGRTGWYLRVLKPGKIEEGDTMELIERLHPQWSITRVQRYLYHDTSNFHALTELSQLPGLGKEIQDLFQERLDKGTEGMNDRLEGIVGKNRIPVAWMRYRLAEKTPITPRVKKFIFAMDNETGDIGNTEFSSFAHVRLKFGPEASFTRAYSVVSGDLRKFELGIALDDDSRGGSLWLHDVLEVGDFLDIAKGNEVQAPQGTNIGIKQATKHIIIIGGIGVTAFLREVQALESSGADYEIHYAVRSEMEAAYLSKLPPGKATIYDKSRGERINVTALIPPPKGNNFDTMIYCCGPPGLLKACRDRTSMLKYPAAFTHYEDFGTAVDSPGEPFEAEVKCSGQVLKVPREKTLLQILNDAGLDVPSSCLVGNCAICMVEYWSGEVEHRGVALDEKQKKSSLLSCVSRGKGRIVVDC